ncbi:hypothetical protein F4560_006708 [Saccharothrix ecbatanensis]|uniref:Uncharacterized protein n=1 Tax=Saccharothrix ecbatanensis TaxID=1105145 RepID=A0A7W9HR65_9PSEU|nr:hypothetical protein [Saccharothrix ecbatanensis]MBB5806940.1 hypothetical protein [Saccharothrix ecbatanensis]
MTENDNTGNSATPGQGGPSGPNGPGGPGQQGGGASPPPYVPQSPQGPPHGQPQGPPQGRGQIRRQEPGATKPRPPTLAEQRARATAIEQQREQQLALEAEEARKKKLRKRLLIGGGVAVGVAGVVAIWYAASSPDDVEAQCTRDDVVVEDQYCDESYARSHGGTVGGGFIYIGGSSYRYHYGGASTPVGQKVSGGSYTMPKGANISTKSGTVVQRGGFGVSGGSKSGGS